MTISNRISREEADFKVKVSGSMNIWTNPETKEYFFSDDYSFPHDMVDSDDWVSCSYRFPNSAAPRKGLESGKILTIDDYLLVFKDDETELKYKENTL